MINILISIFVVLFAGSSDKWIEFESKEGNFTILVPGEMKQQEKSISTEMGEIFCYSYVYQNQFKESENELYVISYCDYPKHSFPRDSVDLIQNLLQVSVEQEVINLNARLSYDHKTKVYGHPGRFFRLSYNDGKVVMKSKIFLVDNRFYTLQVYCKYKNSLNFEMDKFLDSFRFLN